MNVERAMGDDGICMEFDDMFLNIMMQLNGQFVCSCFFFLPFSDWYTFTGSFLL